jgi:acyl-CoA dehydrogenase
VYDRYLRVAPGVDREGPAANVAGLGGAMAALDVERADFLREDDIIIFEKSVERFLDDLRLRSESSSGAGQELSNARCGARRARQASLCLAIPEEYGGANGDFRHEVVLMEQVAHKEISGFAVALHNAIVAPYLHNYGSEEQKKAWLPKMASANSSARWR